MKKRILLVILFLLFSGVAFLVYLGQGKNQNKKLSYSGTLESTQANLAFQVGGRVQMVHVQEGQAVTKGQILAELDKSEFQVRLEQAKANLEKTRQSRRQAEVMLEILNKSAPADVDRAEAMVRALSSQIVELRSGARPQEVEITRQAMVAAKAVLETAQKDWERYDRLYQKDIISAKDRDAVRLKYETSLSEYERKKGAYELHMEGARAETIETAEARLAEANAVLAQAKGNLRRIDAARMEAAGAMSQVKSA